MPSLSLESSDSDLLQYLAKGHDEALKILFDRYFATIMRQAFTMTRDQSLAEELSQDIFIYIWESRQKLNIQSSLKGYLIQSIKYRCYTHFRKLHQSQLEVLGTADEHHDHGVRTESEMETKDLENTLSLGISRLPEKTRAVFLMSREDELSYADIAERLDITIKTVEYHMGNALKYLRKFLEAVGYIWLLITRF